MFLLLQYCVTVPLIIFPYPYILHNYLYAVFEVNFKFDLCQSCKKLPTSVLSIFVVVDCGNNMPWE